MIDPTPVTPPISDPTTPGDKPRPTALGAAAAAGGTGLPAGVLAVWLLETYGTAHGQPLKLDAASSAMIGTCAAAVGGFAWQVGNALVNLLIQKATRP